MNMLKHEIDLTQADAKRLLTPTEYEVYKRFYIRGENTKRIASTMYYSTQWVRKTLKSIRNKSVSFEKKV